MKFYKTVKLLILIAAALIIAIVAVLIGKCSGNANHEVGGSSPRPNVTNSTAPVNTTGLVNPNLSQAPKETDSAAKPTDEPSSVPFSANPSTIPRVVTEGTIDDVYARLNALKVLKAQNPNAVIILLDVGHGGFDPGSGGIDSGVTESELNLAVAKFVAEKLGEKGYYVFMTRMGEYAVANTKAEDMAARTNMMKNDIFTVAISIHMNSFPSDRSVSGTRLFCYPGSIQGQSLAAGIMSKIAAATGQRNRDVVADDLMVVREPICPSALVECGFLSNSSDEANLRTTSYQQTLAQAVADGVQSYIEGL